MEEIKLQVCDVSWMDRVGYWSDDRQEFVMGDVRIIAKSDDELYSLKFHSEDTNWQLGEEIKVTMERTGNGRTDFTAPSAD